MQKVKSSTLHSIGHDGTTFRARFHCTCNKGGEGKPSKDCPKCGGLGHSGEYEYEGVPYSHFETIRDAPSAGKAFALLIKAGKYKFHFTPHKAGE